MTTSGTSTFPMGVWYPPGALETLRPLVIALRYKPGWTFGFKGQGGGLMTLQILMETVESSSGEPFLVEHTLPIPPVPYSMAEWEHWLIDQVLLVERHEACEFFSIGDRRPFYPEHGLEGNPYRLTRRETAIT